MEPAELTQAVMDRWAYLSRTGDALGLARAMKPYGCTVCGRGPARLCGMRDSRVPERFGPEALCDSCAEELSAEPDIAVLRPVASN